MHPPRLHFVVSLTQLTPAIPGIINAGMLCMLSRSGTLVEKLLSKL
jgi:hypothetical protein